MTSSVPLVGYLTRPTVQSKLQAFAEEVAAHVCADWLDGSEEFREATEDQLVEVVEAALRDVSVEGLTGVAGL